MMAFAAVVLSVLALLVAGASAFYTKRQADAAARTATLDAERRYEERTPTFDAWIEPVNGGGWHRLWLRLTSRQDLSAVQVEITEGEGVEFHDRAIRRGARGAAAGTARGQAGSRGSGGNGTGPPDSCGSLSPGHRRSGSRSLRSKRSSPGTSRFL